MAYLCGFSLMGSLLADRRTERDVSADLRLASCRAVTAGFSVNGTNRAPPRLLAMPAELIRPDVMVVRSGTNAVVDVGGGGINGVLGILLVLVSAHFKW
ncbi:hypothetical protein AAVH_06017 [Aphelenchoides avenae]|nr:hypothetical protein AAVH_06017 [Aphelenchus avenae]